MKRKIITLLIAMSVSSAFGATAMAADEINGFYDMGTAQGVVITPYAGDVQVSASEKNIDDDEAMEQVFVDSDKLDVTYSGATANEYYGVILVEGSALPTKDTEIFYINQETAASSSINFNVYPKVPAETTDMTLYISSSKADDSLVVVPMNYAVNEEEATVEPEYRLGDTNGDGDISVKDVVPIRRKIAGGYTVEMNEAAADVNQDGTISVKDVVPIRRFIAGGYGVEL